MKKFSVIARQKGFSLVEIIVMLAVFGLLASVAFIAVTGVRESSYKAASANDLRTLNTAASSYLAFGGSFSAEDDTKAAIAHLQTKAAKETAKQVVGLRGSFLDPSLDPVFQTEEEAEGGGKRILWDLGKKAFVVTNEGPPGIKYFKVKSAEDTVIGEEERPGLVRYAQSGTWIWDYDEFAKSTKSNYGPGPTRVVTDPNGGVPEIPTPLDPPVGPDPSITEPLLPPEISVPTGSFPITAFNKEVSLSNPNASGISEVYYSLNFGDWTRYVEGSTVTVGPDSTLKGQAIPVSPGWKSSSPAEEQYHATPVKLETPGVSIVATDPADPNTEFVVNISNPNDPSNSELKYRINGIPWGTYASSFVLDSSSSNAQNEILVESFAASTAPYWLDSDIGSDQAVVSSSKPELFTKMCDNELLNYGLVILNGGELTSSNSESGVEGNVAIAPGGTWTFSHGSVTGNFYADPSTSGDFGNADDQFGSGGAAISPISKDLSALQQAAITASENAAALVATQTFGKISETTTIFGTAADGVNVIAIEEVGIKSGKKLFISGTADDHFVINISGKVKFSGGSSWSLQGGVKPSNVLFNMLPGATDFEGTGSSDFTTGGIILAPYDSAKIKLTGASVIQGNVITGGEFMTTGGSQLLGTGCDSVLMGGG